MIREGSTISRFRAHFETSWNHCQFSSFLTNSLPSGAGCKELSGFWVGFLPGGQVEQEPYVKPAKWAHIAVVKLRKPQRALKLAGLPTVVGIVAAGHRQDGFLAVYRKGFVLLFVVVGFC